MGQRASEAQGLDGSRVLTLCLDLGSPAALRELTAALPSFATGGLRERGDEAEEEEEEWASEEAEDLGSSETAQEEHENGSEFRVRGSMVEGLSDGNLLAPPDVLLCDPGRNGMPKAFRRILFDLQVPTLIYISSGRALLRDCTLLTRRGYSLERLLPLDSHPHNARLEVIAQLKWRGIDGRV